MQSTNAIKSGTATSTVILFGIVTVLFIFIMLAVMSKAVKFINSSSHRKSFSKEGKEKLVYSNGETITFRDLWNGNIPEGSVFSPVRPDWYFDISGLNSKGELIFSSGWHNHLVLRQIIPKNFEDIKRWQIVVATLPFGVSPSSDVYKKLRIE